MVARPQFKHYEELTASHGRQIFFRAPRLRARELFDRELPLTVVDGHSCTLFDISMSGMSALLESDNGETFTVGAVVPVELRHAEASLHRGRARVVRLEPAFRGQRVALQVVGEHVDIDLVRSRYAEEALRKDLAGLTRESLGPIDQEYRALLADVLEFAQRYRPVLDRAQALNPDIVRDDAAVRRVLAMCEERAVTEWFRLAEHGNALIEALDPDEDALEAALRLTVSVLTPAFLRAPVWAQSYMKPYGYPGDFAMMNYVYENADRGETLHDKFLHRIGLHSSHFLYTRMEALRAVIAQVSEANGGAATHVLSLGSGSAEEVVRFLDAGKSANGVHFTLIDQDEKALSFAYQRAFPKLARQRGTSSVRCLHATFANLMKGGDIARSLVPQDLVYSVGILDYLKAKRAKKLVESLYERVAPGGLLVIGNLRASPKSCRWVTEMVCDWNLIFRNEADMLALTADMHTASITLTTDSTDQVYLLKVRKPG